MSTGEYDSEAETGTVAVTWRPSVASSIESTNVFLATIPPDETGKGRPDVRIA